MTKPGTIAFEYKQRRVIARPVELGWEFQVVSKNGQGTIDRLTARDLSEVIDQAKRVIDIALNGRR
jgi:hypothetical protein